MTASALSEILAVFQKNGPVLKASELKLYGIGSRDLILLQKEGLVRKIRTGYYIWAADKGGPDRLELVQMLIPDGVISIHSAAAIHRLSLAEKDTVAVTIPASRMKPVLPADPQVELFYTSDASHMEGVLEYPFPHGKVKVTGPERTVCDYFRYIKRTGSENAMDVLKTYMADNNRDLKRLISYAQRLRVRRYIEPYVEALK